MINLVGHIILLQLVWWTTILGAVHFSGIPWLIGLWIPVFIGLYKKGFYEPQDLKAACILLGIGIILDTLWIHLGLIEHIEYWPFSWTGPLWLCVLWFTVGFDFRHSLMWIGKNPLFGGSIAGLSGISSYYAGTALGVAQIPAETAPIFIACLFLTWAPLFPLFARYVYPDQSKIAVESDLNTKELPGSHHET